MATSISPPPPVAVASPVVAAKRGKWYCGGIAGAVAVVGTHPLDLMKVRLQVAKTLATSVASPSGSSSSTSSSSAAAASRKVPVSVAGISSSIFRGEGFVGFYRGMTASIMRQLSYSSIRFGAYDFLKSKLTSPENPNLGLLSSLGISCLSGATGGFIGNVFDLVNVRMQSDSGKPEHLRKGYRNGVHGVFRIIRDEGVAGMFTGLVPNIQRAILITAAQIITYERCKEFLKSRGHDEGVRLHFYSSLMSGIVTVTVTNPVDVVKSVVMTSERGAYKSSLHAAGHILKHQGPLGFLKGWTPSYARLGPQTVIIFLVLEQLRQIPMFQADY